MGLMALAQPPIPGTQGIPPGGLAQHPGAPPAAHPQLMAGAPPLIQQPGLDLQVGSVFSDLLKYQIVASNWTILIQILENFTSSI